MLSKISCEPLEFQIQSIELTIKLKINIDSSWQSIVVFFLVLAALPSALPSKHTVIKIWYITAA